MFYQHSFIGMCIVFDTHLEKKYNTLNSFELDVHLVSQDMYEGGELSALNFPVGIVKIDHKENRMYYEELYSDYVWQLQKHIIEEQPDIK